MHVESIYYFETYFWGPKHSIKDETDEDIIVVNEVNRNVANNSKRSTPPETVQQNGEPPIKRGNPDWQSKDEVNIS
jgi:hypothetical protein